MPKKGKTPKGGKAGHKGGAGAGDTRRMLTTDEKVVRVPPAAQASDTIKVRLSQTLSGSMAGSLVWNISGDVYAGIFALLSASPDFVSIGTLWLEYIVQQVRVVVLPRDRYSKLTTVTCAFALGFDQLHIAPTPAWLAALEFGTSRLLSLDDPGELTYSIPANAKDLWYQFGITPPVPVGSFFVAVPTSLTGGTVYMDVILEFTLRVRGRT